MIKAHNVAQGSKEWIALREGVYTGQNAHKLLSFGTIDYALTHANGFSGNWWTRRGHVLEDEAIELYERIRKTKVDRPGFIVNDKYPDCGYSPDGMTADRSIEVKCFDLPQHMKLIDAKTVDDIPFRILAQVYFGMFILEKPRADLIAYNPKAEKVKDQFRIIEVKQKTVIQRNFRRILK